MKTRPIVYGPDGEPLAASRDRIAMNGDREAAIVKNLYSSINSYLTSLGLVGASATYRASEPLANHVWVFAAAMTISVTSSSAPFVIMRESASALNKRKEFELRCNRKWAGPGAGANRRSAERYINVPIQKRLLQTKVLEPDFNHPAYSLLRRPNPILSQQQLIQFTILWLSTRGEVFWVYGDDDGLPTTRDVATQIWPFGPDYFSPLFSKSNYGRLIGWEFRVPDFSPISEKTGMNVRINLPLEVISQFKFVNPLNPTRGMSRLTAAAMSIESSMLVKAHNRGLMKNQAVPRGIISHDTFMDEQEEKEFITKWNQHFSGEGNSGRTGLLNAGFKYQTIALTPEQMQFVNAEEMSRLEVLAAMGTPPGLVGLTDTTNYSTMLVQESGFWSRTILPLFYVIENEVDSTLLYSDTDDVVGLFDVSGIDALRAGISDKVTIADKMANAPLHVPPRVAYEVVGLIVPEYEGDDKAIVSGILSNVDEIINPVDEESIEEVPSTELAVKESSSDARDEVALLVLKGKKRHKQFNSLVTKYTARVKVGYRSWVKSERSKVLSRFDRHAKAEVNIDKIVGDIITSQTSLRSRTLSARKQSMLAVSKFTENDFETIGDIPIIDIGADRFARYFNRQTESFTGDVATTLNNKLRKTLLQGIQDGDTIQELRLRVASAFDIAASSAKALSVARTETANLMNGIRDEMFEEANVSEEEWVNSGDDVVRDTHKVFGASGSKPRNFNYLSLVGKSGTLRYPGDIEGPIEEKVNCRCVKIPVKFK